MRARDENFQAFIEKLIAGERILPVEF